MVLTEFDEEKFLKMMRAEERAEGHKVGLAEGHKAGLAAGRMESLVGILNDLGEIPQEVMARIKELDADALKRWTKLASRSDSMEEFLEQMQLFRTEQLRTN